MPKFTGRLYEVGIAKETNRGVAIEDPLYWIPKTVVTFDDKVAKALVAGSYGHITDAPMTAQVVNEWAEGNIEGEINVNSFGLILLALCGVSDSPGNPETGVYTHDYTIENDVTPDSLTIQVHDPVGDIRFRLAVLNSLSINVALGEMVTYVANFFSKKHREAAAASPTYIIDHRFVSKNLTFKVAAAIDDIANANRISVKSLTLDFARNAERIEMLGTPEPEDIVTKGFRITGTLELDYEDRTWRDYMLNNTIRAMQILFTGSKLIGANEYAKLNMIFPKVHFEAWEPALGLDDIVSQSLNFDVMFDLANTRLWSTFQLQNTHSSQY